MTYAKHSIAPASLCTTMVLLVSPAHAHDGPHQMTYLQGLLHELAYAEYLGAHWPSPPSEPWRPGAFSGAGLSSRTCRKIPTAVCDARR